MPPGKNGNYLPPGKLVRKVRETTEDVKDRIIEALTQYIEETDREKKVETQSASGKISCREKYRARDLEPRSKRQGNT